MFLSRAKHVMSLLNVCRCFQRSFLKTSLNTTLETFLLETFALTLYIGTFLVSVMVIISEIDTATRVQSLDKAVFISLGANTIGKDMNLTIPLQLWVKY